MKPTHIQLPTHGKGGNNKPRADGLSILTESSSRIQEDSTEVPEIGDAIRTKKMQMEGKVEKVSTNRSGYEEVFFRIDDGRLMKTPVDNVIVIQKLADEHNSVYEQRTDELTTELLAKYKAAAGKDATQADKSGDTKRGNKRFSGIVKATNKQFDNDSKKSTKEGLKFAPGSFPDVDHMPGAVYKDWNNSETNRKSFEDYSKWKKYADYLNGALHDDNSEIISDRYSETYINNHMVWAAWNKRTNVGYAKSNTHQQVDEFAHGGENEDWYGPEKSYEMAMAVAQSHIGGPGKDGFNFRIEQRGDGFYWTESVPGSWDDKMYEQRTDELSLDTLKSYKNAAGSPSVVRHQPLRKIVKRVAGAGRAEQKIKTKTGDKTHDPEKIKRGTYEQRLAEFLQFDEAVPDEFSDMLNKQYKEQPASPKRAIYKRFNPKIKTS